MLTYIKLLSKKSLPAAQIADFQCHFSNCSVNARQQQAFRKAMQLAPGQSLPISYEFITAFPYILKVTADKKFAYPALGLIHLSSEFQRHYEFDRSKPFDLNVNVTQDIEHPKGKLVKMTIEFYQNGERCITNTNVMLKRQKTVIDAPKAERKKSEFKQQYFLLITHKLARRYAKVSGDYNPIHLYDCTAKLFGFDRAIIHGMYLCHRLLLDKKIQSDHCLVSFKKPCKLPQEVGVSHQGNTLRAFSNSDQLHMEIELLEQHIAPELS
ncbi:MaoC/PaaZ C-terminal domain-containing protein [Thalassotalea litorea]|uniref:MaoC/PaaZ C-terminal domain-containing protein n=1 Tax=Thalassotalea litorea TaxID=2020715 RepID=UPI00373539D1